VGESERVKRGVRTRTIFLYLFAVLLALWVLFPIVWTVLTSLRIEAEVRTVPPSVTPTTINNYWLLVDFAHASKLFVTSAIYFVPTIAAEMPDALRNSTIIGAAIVAINLTAGSLAAYTFSRLKFRGRWPLFLYAIASRLLPGVAVIIPFYVIIRTFGLLDTTLAVFLIHAAYTLPFSIWVLYTYLFTVPTDIEESALVDGYSRFETLRKVVFPVIWPGLVAVAIFSFMFSYNEFFFAQLLTTTAASHTVPVVVAGIGGELTTPISLVAASGIVAMIPPVVIFVIFRRRIMSGLASGAVK